jgi:hypothetical protein
VKSHSRSVCRSCAMSTRLLQGAVPTALIGSIGADFAKKGVDEAMRRSMSGNG